MSKEIWWWQRTGKEQWRQWTGPGQGSLVARIGWQLWQKTFVVVTWGSVNLYGMVWQGRTAKRRLSQSSLDGRYVGMAEKSVEHFFLEIAHKFTIYFCVHQGVNS
jgi:hypothetical protein